MEILSHIISDKAEKNKWKGIKLSKEGPLISLLFFADDMVLFTKASVDQINVVKECLNWITFVPTQVEGKSLKIKVVCF